MTVQASAAGRARNHTSGKPQDNPDPPRDKNLTPLPPRALHPGSGPTCHTPSPTDIDHGPER